MSLGEGRWLGGDVHPIGFVAAFAVLLQLLLQFGKPFGYQVNVLDQERSMSRDLVDNCVKVKYLHF